MRWLILAISLLATSNLPAVVNSINSKQEVLKVTNSDNDQKTKLQKVKLPLINNKLISIIGCYQLSYNIFIYLDFQTVNNKEITNLYYIDVTDINNIKVTDCGQIPSLLKDHYLLTVNVNPKKIILYYPEIKAYLYFDVNNLSKPITKKIIAPSIAGHNGIIKSINYIGENNFLIRTQDGFFITNLSDIDHPQSKLCNSQNIEMSKSLQINDTKYLVSSVIPSPQGQKFQLFLFDFTNDWYNPQINKINLNLSSFKEIRLVKLLNDDSFAISLDNNLYYLNCRSIELPVLKNLNIKFTKFFNYLEVIDTQNFIIANSVNNKQTSNAILWSAHIDNNNVVCKQIELPFAKNDSFYGFVYLGNNNFVARVSHDGNKIVSFILNLNDQSHPKWTDVGLGAGHYIWDPIKLSQTSVLLAQFISATELVPWFVTLS